MASIKDILGSYTTLLGEVDAATKKVYAGAPEIPCRNKCFDCCKQLFPISFVEAYHISKGVHETMPLSLLEERKRTALSIQKKILAGNPLQFEKRDVERVAALNTHAEFAKYLYTVESNCPALDPENPAGACTVYEFRNHDCRSMGAAFDATSNEIIGCHRFKNLGHLIPNLMSFSYKYKDKMALDAEMIQTVTDGAFGGNIIYLTTLCNPFLKDYTKGNWTEFFKKKLAGNELSDVAKFAVVIDV